MTLDRRQFLAGAAGASAALLGGCAAPSPTPPTAAAAPALPFLIGNPAQTLLEKNGAYARLHAMQFADEASSADE